MPAGVSAPEDCTRFTKLLNDNERPVKADVMDAFRSYDVMPVRWSERKTVRAEPAT